MPHDHHLKDLQDLLSEEFGDLQVHPLAVFLDGLQQGAVVSLWKLDPREQDQSPSRKPLILEQLLTPIRAPTAGRSRALGGPSQMEVEGAKQSAEGETDGRKLAYATPSGLSRGEHVPAVDVQHHQRPEGHAVLLGQLAAYERHDVVNLSVVLLQTCETQSTV
ncbi:hypothetical protein EYF80_010256 [Liparis tanakae]|uniref:Uncharacterized protein n=1 Tax=Liparis tanakae TaxID=230148 RepID=A0A4Z2IQF1_9TELE|nr:hypothetical protein EYF80_010256 [Liparis tanakae]